MLPTDLFGKTILISPLNWGMGHVSRCIPLIKKLKTQNNQIILACNEIQRTVFESYVGSNVQFIKHEGYPFHFNGLGHFVKDILMNLKKLKNRHTSELLKMDELVEKHNIDLIISDHRYGFRSEKCICIFMTHQLILPLPWYFSPAQMWHKKQISKFDFQWIVDDQEKRLAGKLSDNNGFLNSKYIGLLSRFDYDFSKREKLYQGVLLISGPTEYNQNLIESFKKQLVSGEINFIIGNDESFKVFKSFNLTTKFHNSIDWNNTDEIIIQSKKIFGYCGYSTLMDIQYLKCETDLIACPGQLEQLYLQKKVLRNSQDFHTI